MVDDDGDVVANDVDVAVVKRDGRKAVDVLVISGELRFKRECVKRANTFVVVVLRGDAFINSIICCYCYGGLGDRSSGRQHGERSASFKEEEAMMTVFVLCAFRRKKLGVKLTATWS